MSFAEKFRQARERIGKLVIELTRHMTTPAGNLTNAATAREMAWLLLDDTAAKAAGPEEELRRLKIACWLGELAQLREERGWDPEDDSWPPGQRRPWAS